MDDGFVAARGRATGERRCRGRSGEEAPNRREGADMVSELFDPDAWKAVEGVPGPAFTDITYHRAVDQGTVRIAFNRPEVRNAFRPGTVDELYRAVEHARLTADVGCILL